MPNRQRFLSTLLASAQSSGQRGSVLTPLQWTLATLISGIVLGTWRGAADWLLVGMSVGAAVVLGVMLYWYAHFAKRDPDALRSERYTLSKMAIEKGLVGDDRVGLIDPLDDDQEKLPSVGAKPFLIGKDEESP